MGFVILALAEGNDSVPLLGFFLLVSRSEPGIST